MIDESTVRDKVREAIQMGKLPHRLPDRTHDGRGTEGACAACGDLVRRDQMEIRMELVGYASPIAWEFVLAAGDLPRPA